MSCFSSYDIRIAVDSANDGGLKDFMFQEPSSNRRRTKNCGCSACNKRRTSRKRCTRNQRRTSRRRCTTPGRGSVWYPSRTSRRRCPSADKRRSCGRRSSNHFKCACRERQHSKHPCHSCKHHRKSFNWANFLF